MKWQELQERINELSHHDLASRLARVMEVMYVQGDEVNPDAEHDADTLGEIANVLVDLIGGAE